MPRHKDVSKPELTRALGLIDCTLLVVGAIIGSGIYLTPSIIARTTQSVEAMLLVWIVGGLLTFCGAVSYAELGALYPEAGGIYVFLNKCYGSAVAFLYGWCVFLVILPGSIATLANAFAIYLDYLTPASEWSAKLVAVGLIMGLTVINCLGIRSGAVIQNVLTGIKIVSLIGISVVLFYFDGNSNPDTAASWCLDPSSFPLWSAMGIAMVAVLWSYDGWHLLTSAAGEIRNPQKNLTGGLLLGTGIVILLYFVVNLSYLHMLGFEGVSGSLQVASEAMERALGRLGGSLVAVAIVISIAGAMNSNILGGPRVPFAMARDRLFFSSMSRVHPRYHVPSVAIVTVGVWAAVLTLIGTFEELFNYVIFVAWIFYGLGAAAVILLRNKEPEKKRPYKAWGYPVVPLVFSLAALAIVLNNLVNNFDNSIWGLLVVATGFPAFLFWSRRS